MERKKSGGSGGVFVRGIPKIVLEELKALTGADTYAAAIDAAIKAYGQNSRFILMNQDLIEQMKLLAIQLDDEGYRGVKRVIMLLIEYLRKSMVAAEIDLTEALARFFEDEGLREEVVRILLNHLRKKYRRMGVLAGEVV